MKPQLVLPLALLAIAALPAPSAATHQAPDGVTAKILGGAGSLVFAVPDANGDYQVQVSIFRNLSGTWQPVAMQATLRAFVFNATSGVEEDRLSVPFTSKAGVPVAVRFHKSLIGTNFADVFVTFSELGGDPVPTSHHNLAKNALIDRGLYDQADLLDYHANQRPLFFG